MVLQILDSDLGNIDTVPTRLNDFLQKYIRSSGSEEFLAKETKSFSTQDGKFSKAPIPLACATGTLLGALLMGPGWLKLNPGV